MIPKRSRKGEVSSASCVVAPMRSTTTSWLVKGRPRQFILESIHNKRGGVVWASGGHSGQQTRPPQPGSGRATVPQRWESGCLAVTCLSRHHTDHALLILHKL